MSETKLHKRAQQVLRKGDKIGLSSGDTITIGRILENPSYSGHVNTKKLRADLAIETTDGVTVYIELNYTHAVDDKKLSRISQIGIHNVVEIDLSEKCWGYSDEELRAHIVQGNFAVRRAPVASSIIRSSTVRPGSHLLPVSSRNQAIISGCWIAHRIQSSHAWVI